MNFKSVFKESALIKGECKRQEIKKSQP